MGRDKAFLEIAGVPMIEHVLRALRKTVSRIIVVTNTPEAYARYNVSVFRDVYDKRGPLTGIYSGLLESRDDYNIVVACDMPFLQPALLTYMGGLCGPFDVILPKLGDFVEPLHAVYNRSLLDTIDSHIRREQRQIRAIFNGLRVRYVTEAEIDRFDRGRRSFININTPAEYEEVVCSDLECLN